MSPDDIGLHVARLFFKRRGDNSEAHVSEAELAAVVSVAIERSGQPQLLKALDQVGCRTAKVYLAGRTCREVVAAGERFDLCFVCAAVAKARGGA